MKTLTKILLLTTFCILYSAFCLHSQNLVPNPSFEDTVACPDGYMQTNKALGWIINVNSADYFHSCDHPPPPTSFSTPENSFGYQIPATGDAYCGLYNYIKTIAGDVREYFGRGLSPPLTPGNKYYVSFKASLADSWCATNKLGVLFSNKYYGDSTSWGVIIVPPPLINDFAHVYTNNLITDSINWTTIHGSFIADSAYQYFYIGNFFSRTNTDTLVQSGQQSCVSYYYIDDVCISEDSLTCNQSSGFNINHLNNKLNLFPNPTDGIFYITNILSSNIISLNIYDILGRCQNILFSKSKNEITIDMNSLKTGTYFLLINSDNIYFREKIIKL